jgi:hypothetical protein
MAESPCRYGDCQEQATKFLLLVAAPGITLQMDVCFDHWDQLRENGNAGKWLIRTDDGQEFHLPGASIK